MTERCQVQRDYRHLVAGGDGPVTGADSRTAGNDVAGLSYLIVGATDLGRWRAFAGDVLGLQPVDHDGDGLRFRTDGQAWRLAVVDGDDDLTAVGWEAADDDALDRLRGRLVDAGVPVEVAPPALAEDRGVERLLTFTDPAGIPTELCVSPREAAAPFSSPLVDGGFLTGDLGMGHAVLAADDLRASTAFYRDVLGMGLSDVVHEVLSERFTLEVAFLHTNRRHHSVAFANARGPKRIHHFMLEMATIDDVGRAYDRCVDGDVPISLTLGRHVNDRAVSFYVRSPSGFDVEIGWDARVVDPHSHETGRFADRSAWGHRPPVTAS